MTQELTQKLFDLMDQLHKERNRADALARELVDTQEKLRLAELCLRAAEADRKVATEKVKMLRDALNA